MNSSIKKPAYILLLFLIPLFLGSCSIFSSGEDSPNINDPVPHANGMYIPETCGEQGNSLAMLGHLDLKNYLIDVWSYYDQQRDSNYALVGFQNDFSEPGGGFYVIDISNPRNPTLTATVEGIKAKDIVVWKNFIYIINNYFNEGQVKVEVFDLSDPSHPQKEGEFNEGLEDEGKNMFVAENGYLYIAGPGINIYDLVSDPTNPELIWSDKFGGAGYDIAVFGDWMFAFNRSFNALLFDVSNPYKPDQQKIFKNDELVRQYYSGWISKDKKYLYINDRIHTVLDNEGYNDIIIWDIESAEVVSTYRDMLPPARNNLYTICDRLVTPRGESGVGLFDISDPTQLNLLDTSETDSDSSSINYLYPYTQSQNILAIDDNSLYVMQLQ